MSAELILLEFSRLFESFTRLKTAPQAVAYVRSLGWDFQGEIDLTGLAEAVADIVVLIDGAIDVFGEEELDESDLLSVLGEVMTKLPSIVDGVSQGAERIQVAVGAANATDLAESLGIEILDRIGSRLITDYLDRYHRGIGAALRWIGFLEEHGGAALIRWGRLPLLFTDPAALAAEVYGWGSEAEGGVFAEEEFLRRTQEVFTAFSIVAGIYPQQEAIREALGRAADARELRIPFWRIYSDEIQAELGAVLCGASDASALAAFPYAYLRPGATDDGGLSLGEEMSHDGWRLLLRPSGSLVGGFGLMLEAPARVSLDTHTFTDVLEGGVEGSVELELRREEPDDQLTYVLGGADRTHVAYRHLSFVAGAAVLAGAPQAHLEAEIAGLVIKLTGEGADGFLAMILDEVQIEIETDLAVGLSTQNGFYFRGSGGLEIEIPIDKTLGPVVVHSVTVGAHIKEDELAVSVGASFGGKLGPLSVAVSEMGLEIPGQLVGSGGNMGPVNWLGPRFKPPTGAGLSLDAEGMSGGGYLEFDYPNGRYAGVLGFTFMEIGLTAIGLVTTEPIVSVLINIGITFDPPFQLGMGFTLSGVGGLLGVQRTIATDELRLRFRQRALESILFPNPKTVVDNADKIIGDLRAIFPPSPGQFIIGPMVKIGYGTPNIINAEVGLFIELPDPVKVLLLGRLSMKLPTADEAIVRINLDLMGMLDVARKEISFLASLYDSGILTFELVGDAAFLLRWGEQPEFTLSIGGFHPRFEVPAPASIFGGMKRVGLNLCDDGSAFQLSCGAYQALTPNTLQFGSETDLYAKFGAVEITAYFTFDALFTFSPFSFEIDLAAGASVKVGGRSLLDVAFRFTLSGPSPWRAAGVATIKVLFFDIDASFDHTFGAAKPVRLPPVNPLEEVREALHAVSAWNALSVAPGSSSALSVWNADSEVDTAGMLVVDPSGRLELRQTRVPLDRDLELVGNAPLIGFQAVRVGSLKIEDALVPFEPVEEYFARGQFEVLSDGEKLSAPAFERMVGGVRTVVDSTPVVGEAKSAVVNFESVVLREREASIRGFAMAQWNGGVGLGSPLLSSEPLVTKAVMKGFVVVDAHTLASQGLPFTTYSEAQQALVELNRAGGGRPMTVIDAELLEELS